jgi:SAM-dependent methyltransferase
LGSEEGVGVASPQAPRGPDGRRGGREFWAGHQPDPDWLEGAAHGSVQPEAFAAVRAGRYRRYPHLEALAGFADHAGELVCEVGCGLGVDGTRFIEGGARYVGIEPSGVPARTARRTVDLLGLRGAVVQGDATALPIASATVDYVYCVGVLHYVQDTAAAVREIHRVLRPGGRCLVMLHHRWSLKYYVSILFLRRLGVSMLLVPGGTRLVRWLTGTSEETAFAGHRAMLRRHGLTYLTDRRLFLSHNTDGVGNQLSKVFSRRQVQELFAGFDGVETEVRNLYVQALPVLDRLLGPTLKERLRRHLGWELFVRATRLQGGDLVHGHGR